MTGFRCPKCRKNFEVQQPAVLPFCSVRCKMADLHGWLSEDYSVPTNLEVDPDGEEDAADWHWADDDGEQSSLA